MIKYRVNTTLSNGDTINSGTILIPDATTIPIANSTTLGGVMPVNKTDGMTQEVGVDSTGKLYTAPGGGGGSGTASGTNATALGNNATASGNESIAIGYNANANGISATALGGGASASGASATALGRSANASGNYSTALGYNATASRICTIAIGYNATASGNYSTALGWMSKASSTSTTAIGYNANASGTYSTAIGYNANASTANTIVLGDSTITSLRCQVQTISALSDSRVKEDVTLANTAQCLVDVNRLPVSRFKYKDFTGTHLDVHRTGFMADDVEKVFPKSVATADETFPVLDEEGNKVYEQEVDEEGNPVMKEKTFVMKDVKSIAMEMAIPTLWGAVQELTKRVESLEAERKSTK